MGSYTEGTNEMPDGTSSTNMRVNTKARTMSDTESNANEMPMERHRGTKREMPMGTHTEANENEHLSMKGDVDGTYTEGTK
ncbi:hypothetical protein AVEN_184614-1 [Araneus ventricosus]|uniref:Uncharacterized protein n=1 Tax=Araneus ventricosus TaxID=182803 RepID=A0A4Y2E8H2_ARAVE|nr:hypothetical protein AVEN_184614-1 [Araneus ventricosus]